MISDMSLELERETYAKGPSYSSNGKKKSNDSEQVAGISKD